MTRCSLLALMDYQSPAMQDRRRMESRDAGALCAEMCVACVVAVVVECAARGRWSSNMNDGFATTQERLVVDMLSQLAAGVKADSGAGRRVTLYTCWLRSLSGQSGALPT